MCNKAHGMEPRSDCSVSDTTNANDKVITHIKTGKIWSRPKEQTKDCIKKLLIDGKSWLCSCTFFDDLRDVILAQPKWAGFIFVSLLILYWIVANTEISLHWFYINWSFNTEKYYGDPKLIFEYVLNLILSFEVIFTSHDQRS